MRKLYGKWIENWENRLCSAATNRVVRPFEWGLEWTGSWPCSQGSPQNGYEPHTYLKLLSEHVVENSKDFYTADRVTKFELKDGIVEFASSVKTPYPDNDLVRGQWFPAADKPGKRRVAVVVLPHWNSHATQHGALCRGMAKLGISALRLSLPYHDSRMPPELQRADYAVSSNIARTIDATRQAVLDIRGCVDWLEREGYESIGIVGTSLGSCYAFLASVHDPRLRVNVFNHCSTYFADVVWEGLSTQHIRKSFENAVTIDQLRDAWKCISPPYFIDRYAELNKKPLFIYTQYDTTFPTRLSEQVIEKARELGMDHKAVVLPCGHYTLGESPFKFMVGYHIVSFLKRNL